jgi:hypothetical protein
VNQDLDSPAGAFNLTASIRTRRLPQVRAGVASSQQDEAIWRQYRVDSFTDLHIGVRNSQPLQNSQPLLKLPASGYFQHRSGFAERDRRVVILVHDLQAIDREIDRHLHGIDGRRLQSATLVLSEYLLPRYSS